MRIYSTMLAFLFLSFTAFAQNNITWSAPLTVADKSFGNLHPRISLDGKGNPYLVWGSTNSKVYFSKWTGTAFSMPKALNQVTNPAAGATWMGPDLASHGDTVYVTFRKIPETMYHSYILCSYDGGTTFSAPLILDNISDSLSRFPIVTTDQIGNPVVAYMKFDKNLANATYVVTTSKDFGKTFTTSRLASSYNGETVCNCCPATVISDNKNVIMLYRNDNNNLRDMWAGVSTDEGLSFPKGFHAENTNWMLNACPASGPSGVVIGDSLYNVFMSQASGTSLVYFSKSTISGMSNVSTIPLSGKFTGLSSQNYPRMATDGKSAAVVWRQTASSQEQLCIKSSKSIQNGLPSNYEVIATGSVVCTDVKMKDGKVYVVWEDDNNGTIMYREGSYSTSGIEEGAEIHNTLGIYPNPANNMFTIEANGMKDLKRIYITDVLGKQTEMKGVQILEGKYSFDTKNFSPGLYHVKAVDDAGNYEYSKLIITR